MSRLRIAIWGVVSFLILLPPAFGGQIPKHLSHQGVLTDPSGVVVPDGTHTLEFGIYDAPSSGNLLFSQELEVEVVGGLYNVLLSNNTGSPGSLESAFQDPTTYLQITITGVPAGSAITPPQALLPRQKMASVPYAFSALNTNVPEALQEIVFQQVVNDDAEIVVQFPSGFDRFEFELIDVIPVSTTPVDIVAHVSSDGGTTWDEGASDYEWMLTYSVLYAPFNPGDRTLTNGLFDDSQISLNNRSDAERLINAPGKSYNAHLVAQNPGSVDAYFVLTGEASYSANGWMVHHTSTGVRKDPALAPVNAVRFKMSSGNIKSGRFKVYGIR